MIFGNKRKRSVIEFFDYVENILIPSEKESEVIELVKKQLKEGRELIEHNEWGVAFENLASELVEHYIIVNREGESHNYLYREESMEDDEERDYVDTGWRIMTGKETDEYIENGDNFSFVSLGAVLSRDDSFIEILESEIGSTYERSENGKFEKIK